MRWRWVILTLWLACLSIATYRYVQVWESEMTLWAHAAVVTPFKSRPNINYAKALYGEGRIVEARLFAERASELQRWRR